jgi:hypothetical protein
MVTRPDGTIVSIAWPDDNLPWVWDEAAWHPGPPEQPVVAPPKGVAPPKEARPWHRVVKEVEKPAPVSTPIRLVAVPLHGVEGARLVSAEGRASESTVRPALAYSVDPYSNETIARPASDMSAGSI